MANYEDHKALYRNAILNIVEELNCMIIIEGVENISLLSMWMLEPSRRPPIDAIDVIKKELGITE